MLGLFTCVPVLSDDSLVQTTITNTEELIENISYTEELVRSVFLALVFLFVAPGQIPPQTS